MPLIPVGKGDFRLLPQFAEGDFPGYELYLPEFDDKVYNCLEALPGHIKIISIHQPPSVRVDGQLHRSNMVNFGRIGEATVFSMKKIVELCHQRGIPQVVVHGAFYDCREREQQEAFSLFTSRLKSLSHPEVELLCENDALWGPDHYSIHSLLCTMENFLLLNKLMDGKIKITLDIEHFLITHYFTRFLGSITARDTDFYVGSEERGELLQKDFLSFHAPQENVLKQTLYSSLGQFISFFNDQIEMVHLNGSDFHNFMFDAGKKLPLIGEHLPLGFDQGGVKDRIDYGLLVVALQKLPHHKNIPLVLEVWRKDPGEFIAEMRRSKQFLTNYLS